jgi:hypothetical protein
LTRKVSRAALVAGLAIGASGLVAVPAEAANGIATANYYVNQPAVTGAATVTPESAVVTGAIDTGGNPETLLPVPAGSPLSWDGNITISAGIKWVDNTTGNFVPVDGLPVSGSSSKVSVTVTDNTNTGPYSAATINGVPLAVSNGGADNYSDITFEYDPVSDYDAVDGQPGPNVQFAQDVQVPTSTGISPVTTTIGAFGLTAQNNTGNTPLTPGTKYYYWIVQQAGATDAATNVDISSWSGGANPSDKCYPNVAIAADPTLASYTTATQINALNGATPPVVTAAPALQGPCIYYYGNTGGQLYYQSPNGTFTTPKLGNVKIGAKATVKGTTASLAITNASAYKASGTVDLTVGGKLAGTAKFSVKPNIKGSAKITLNSKGKTALKKGQAVKVAPISATANVTSVSNFDQPFSGKSVKL